MARTPTSARPSNRHPGGGPSVSRVLLLLSRTSYRAEAFVAAAHSLDVAITVGSNHRQALADLTPGGALTLGVGDVDRSVAIIVRFASDYPLTAIVAAEDDFTPVAAEASDALGLRHHPPEAVRSARNKAVMRQQLEEAGFPSPWFQVASVEDDAEAAAGSVRYPCVLKPLALSASRGVIRADTPEEFGRAWRQIREILAQPDALTRSGHGVAKILIEAYMPGGEVAVEGIVVGGQLKTLAVLDKPDPMEGPYFEETILVTPSRLPESVQREIVSCVQRSVDILGLDNGPVHAELRVDAERASLLEIAPRSIGGRCSTILRFEPEATLEELILRHALGMPIDEYSRAPGAGGVMMLPIPDAGVLREVGGSEAALEVPGIDGLEITIPVSHKVVPLPEGNRYLGFLFARAATPEQVETALRAAYAKLDVKIEPS
ncbi:MAG: ATP-grasp domain-containing protein [Gemmatimonadetes bacterium]|nr:ATP-grasp domain-containing protein [Gemmatimonadota bacterium]